MEAYENGARLPTMPTDGLKNLRCYERTQAPDLRQ